MNAILMVLGLIAGQPAARLAQIETCQWPHRCAAPQVEIIGPCPYAGVCAQPKLG